jgi:hypothetical protein
VAEAAHTAKLPGTASPQVTFRSANALYDVSAEHPMPWRLEDATGGVVSTPDDAPEDAATTVADDAKKGEGADEAEAAKQKDVSALAAVGLTVGCRLEVLWDVAKGGEGGEEFTAEVRLASGRADSLNQRNGHTRT